MSITVVIPGTNEVPGSIFMLGVGGHSFFLEIVVVLVDKQKSEVGRNARA